MVRYDIDWLGVKEEAAELLRGYLRINTVNPPGNEMEAARYLERVLRKEGVEVKIYEPAPQRGNLVAVCRGGNGGRPLILLHHMDVVPVEQGAWEVDPFGGIVKDGYIYGRGAIDMKGQGAAALMALLLLKRYKIPLKRDVVFLATADEEVGGRLGTSWMLQEVPLLREADCVLNEGGFVLLKGDGALDHYEVATAQKVVAQFAVKAKGRGGHGSVPHPDSAAARLIRALDRLIAWEPPIEVIPLVKTYFANLAKVRGEPRYADIEAALADPAFAKELVANPQYNAMVRNTLTPTILKAGQKINVIPSEAEAAFDCRLLPGTNVDGFFTRLKEVIGDEGIEVIPLMDFLGECPPPSPVDHELYRAIERVAQRKDPGGAVTPFLITGATDSRFFRQIGVPCYDFSPFRLRQEEALLIHGANERLSIDNLAFACEFLFEIITDVAA